MASELLDVTGWAAAASGGLTGLLGVFGKALSTHLQWRHDAKMYELETERNRLELQDRALNREHQLALADKTAASAREENAVKLQLGALERSMEGLKASLMADAADMAAARTNLSAMTGPIAGSVTILQAIVEAVKSLTRPLLTFGLWVGVWTQERFGAIPSAEAYDMARMSMDANIFAAMAATLWWFGERAPDWMQNRQSTGARPAPVAQPIKVYDLPPARD